jgi:hypothetical protein
VLRSRWVASILLSQSHTDFDVWLSSSDDGSTDGTKAWAESQPESRVRGVRLRENKGVGVVARAQIPGTPSKGAAAEFHSRPSTTRTICRILNSRSPSSSRFFSHSGIIPTWTCWGRWSIFYRPSGGEDVGNAVGQRSTLESTRYGMPAGTRLARFNWPLTMRSWRMGRCSRALAAYSGMHGGNRPGIRMGRRTIRPLAPATCPQQPGFAKVRQRALPPHRPAHGSSQTEQRRLRTASPNESPRSTNTSGRRSWRGMARATGIIGRREKGAARRFYRSVALTL